MKTLQFPVPNRVILTVNTNHSKSIKLCSIFVFTFQNYHPKKDV